MIFIDTLYFYVRIIAFAIVLYLLVYDLFIRKVLIKKDLTLTNYIGIAVIIFFIIWPGIDSATFGSFAFNKRIESVESTVKSVQETVNDIFTRKTIEYWFSDKVEIFPVEKIDKFYHYEIQLKDRPVVNTVELWVSNTLTNPKFYTVDYGAKKITLRHTSPPDQLDYLVFAGGEPLFTVQYIKE